MKVATVILVVFTIGGVFAVDNGSKQNPSEFTQVEFEIEKLTRELSFTVEQIWANAGESAITIYDASIIRLEERLNRPVWRELLTAISEAIVQISDATSSDFFDGLDEALNSLVASQLDGTLGTRLVARIRRAVAAIMEAIESFPDFPNVSILMDLNLLTLVSPWVSVFSSVGSTINSYLNVFSYAGPGVFHTFFFAFFLNVEPETSAIANELYTKVKAFADELRDMWAAGSALYQQTFDALNADAKPYIQLAWTQFREWALKVFQLLPPPLNAVGVPEAAFVVFRTFYSFLLDKFPQVLAKPQIWGSLDEALEAAFESLAYTDYTASLEAFVQFYVQMDQAIGQALQSVIDSA